VKALLLLGLALFLYTRLASGTIYFYINERFVGYTMLAIVALLLLGVSYRPQGRRQPAAPGGGHEAVAAPELGGATPVLAAGGTPESSHLHAHGQHLGDNGPHTHDHHLTWAGVALVLLPIILGVLAPPQPLGAAALANREVNVGMAASALPAAVRAAAQKDSAQKNVLDWLHTFAGVADPGAAFAGQPAKVVGFVYRDERFAPDQFMVTRFVVSCCVADANVAGLVVRWPDAGSLAADQWVEVVGALAPGQLDGEALPVLAADRVAPVSVPEQPYLYP
jgi:uncharacterized repeat protein (TIGR03943 family)